MLASEDGKGVGAALTCCAAGETAWGSHPSPSSMRIGEVGPPGAGKPAELPRRAFFIRRLAIVRGDLAKALVAGSTAGSMADRALCFSTSVFTPKFQALNLGMASTNEG
jgi:hypothetical protein